MGAFRSVGERLVRHLRPTMPASIPDGLEEAREELTRIETEYDAYSKRVSKVLFRGFLVAVLAVGILGWMSFIVSLDRSASRVEMLLPPVVDDASLAVFGVLAAVTIGVQLAVRSKVAALPVAADLARRRFLSQFAMVLVVLSIGFGIYASVPAWLRFPILDVWGMFGPLVGGFGLALLAADATMADAEEPHQALRQTVENEKWRAEQDRRIAALSGGSRAPGPLRVFIESGALFLLPTSLAAALAFIGLDGSGPAVVVAAILSLASAAVVYYGVWDTFRAGVGNTWSYLGLTTIAGPFLLLLWFYAVTAASALGASSIRELAITAIVATLMIALPAGLALVLLGPHRPGGTRHLLRQMALRAEERRLSRATEREASQKIPWNNLAVAALVFSPVFPFGIVLGLVARTQLKAAGVDHEGRAHQRGAGLIRAAWYVAWVGLLLFLTALVVLAAVNPA